MFFRFALAYLWFFCFFVFFFCFIFCLHYSRRVGPEERLRFEKEILKGQKTAEEAHQQTHELMRERKRLQKLMRVTGAKKQSSKKRGGKRKLKHKEMGQTKATFEVDGTYDHNDTTEELKIDPPSVKTKRRSSFARVKDPNTGKDYYHNQETGETSWQLPQGAELIDDSTKQ